MRTSTVFFFSILHQMIIINSTQHKFIKKLFLMFYLKGKLLILWKQSAK